MTVKLQVKESIGSVRALRVVRMNGVGIVQMFECARAGNANRPVDFHHSEAALVVELVELDFVVASDDDARDVLLASLPLVVVERADAAPVPVILLLNLRLRIIEKVTLVLVVTSAVRNVSDAACVDVIVIGKLNMLGW